MGSQSPVCAVQMSYLRCYLQACSHHVANSGLDAGKLTDALFMLRNDEASVRADSISVR
jgi:hypothetical protein